MAATHLFFTTSKMTAVISYCWGNKSCRNLEAWRNCRSLQLLVIDVFKKSNIWNIKSLRVRKWSLKWDLYSLGCAPVRAPARHKFHYSLPKILTHFFVRTNTPVSLSASRRVTCCQMLFMWPRQSQNIRKIDCFSSHPIIPTHRNHCSGKLWYCSGVFYSVQ